jgi:hypothetical protein
MIKGGGGGYTRIEDTQRIVTEIEMLKVVLYLVLKIRRDETKNRLEVSYSSR